MMFTITADDIKTILRDYHINAACSSYTELQRYHYEEDDPSSREVRLIVKARLENGHSLVIRFKNEEDAPQDVIEAQSRFAALLYGQGIETPKTYVSDGLFTRNYSINGYDVIVTVEEFMDGEIKTVDPQTAKDTGELLARMHNTAEAHDFHVNSEVLFDPLATNDLFFYESFEKRKERLLGIDSDLYNSIVQKHDELISRIASLERGKRYAVQGDISDCNLYRTQDGRIGVFDFNRCGDNSLFFDAVMQAVFESRLMDYPEELDGHQEEIIFSSFLEGYQQVRPFTAEQKEAFPYLYALITAFWGVDMKWADKSCAKTVDEADDATVHQWMKAILERESAMYTVPA